MKNIKKALSVFVVVVCMLSLSSFAMAAGVGGPFEIDNVPNIIGVGVAMLPDYIGSDDYTAGAAPFFRWTFAGQERYLQLMVTELSFNIINDPNFAFGPVVNYRFGRDDSIEDDVVKDMEEIEDTVEVGAFASYTWREPKNPRHRFIASAEALFDVGDEYKGWVGLASARYWFPVSRPIDLLFGVGATYGNGQYMDKYFGVSTTDAATTGLSHFEAEDGFRDVNAQFAAVFHFSESWHVGAGVKYFNLMSDASDSPIVDDRGDSSQFVYGLGVAYSW
ncbi:MAG: MipA/OmpV family protein [Thermodesulfovibrionales bacterium]